MATLRKRNNKWHVQIRRIGHPSQSKSFLSKADAHVWARHIEGEMDKAALPIDNTRVLEQMTVADLITRYRDNVTINKRGVASESKRLEVFLRYKWANSHELCSIFNRCMEARVIFSPECPVSSQSFSWLAMAKL